MLPIGSKYKIARRLGPIFEKTQSQKFALRQQRRTPVRRRGNVSEFAKQLLEKQKLRLTYGLKERNLVNYVNQALSGSSDTQATLYSLLERRLDSVVYRAGMAETRRHARQMVSHGHFMVNGRKVTVPSIQVRVGDVISVREGSKTSILFNELGAKRKDFKAPAWMTIDWKQLAITIASLPETAIYDFNFKQIIQFYTK